MKTGIIPKETAIIYNSLFERRQEGDYDVFVTFKETDVKPWLKEAAMFVETIVNVIKKDSK